MRRVHVEVIAADQNILRVRSFEDGEEATDDLTVMALRYLGQP